MFLSDLDQLSLMTWVSLPKMSAKPSLAFMKVLHGILRKVESAKAYVVSCATQAIRPTLSPPRRSALLNRQRFPHDRPAFPPLELP